MEAITIYAAVLPLHGEQVRRPGHRPSAWIPWACRWLTPASWFICGPTRASGSPATTTGKAYYRAFWRAPASCAVREPHAKYTGETRFPLILQNLHRYFLYVALIFNVILTWDDVAQAFRNH